MILFKRGAALQAHLQEQRQQGKSIGFVPTMGALHNGHASLLQTARSGNDLVVCSIFVNPTQFNDPADYNKYPITLERDIEQLHNAETDILYLPSVVDIYPEGTQQLATYDIGFLDTVFEGQYRPGHFQGVSQVMHRLLNVVQPSNLYMGQKDYQQCMVVTRLLEITQLPVRLHTCATLREETGLAMSSRNTRLSAENRTKAALISNTLQRLQQELLPGNTEPTIAKARQTLTEAGFVIDYLALANAQTLEPVVHWDGRINLVALAAMFLGDVRLIDNMLIPARY